MNNLLKCELCDYESKQLHQHLRASHKITPTEYRNMFGHDKVMQINHKPPSLINIINKKQSDVIKKSRAAEKAKLNNIKEIFSRTETSQILVKDNLYKNFIGKSKDRTLLKYSPKLYKSIYNHSDVMLKYFKNVTLPQRLRFIVEFKYDTNKLKCYCGNTYTFNKYCLYCPVDRANVKGTHMSNESKKKCRLSTIKYLEKCKGQLAPRYNINSISIIEAFGKEHNYIFQHAENGGEFHIKELGYFVDGYDKENNVVLEIDENHHFNHDGTLKERDIQRQKEITELLGCKFIRIKYETE